VGAAEVAPIQRTFRLTLPLSYHAARTAPWRIRS
jgi:hypothetical protein